MKPIEEYLKLRIIKTYIQKNRIDPNTRFSKLTRKDLLNHFADISGMLDWRSFSSLHPKDELFVAFIQSICDKYFKDHSNFSVISTLYLCNYLKQTEEFKPDINHMPFFLDGTQITYTGRCNDVFDLYACHRMELTGHLLLLTDMKTFYTLKINNIN